MHVIVHVNICMQPCVIMGAGERSAFLRVVARRAAGVVAGWLAHTRQRESQDVFYCAWRL